MGGEWAESLNGTVGRRRLAGGRRYGRGYQRWSRCEAAAGMSWYRNQAPRDETNKRKRERRDSRRHAPKFLIHACSQIPNTRTYSGMAVSIPPRQTLPRLHPIPAQVELTGSALNIITHGSNTVQDTYFHPGRGQNSRTVGLPVLTNRAPFTVFFPFLHPPSLI